MWDTVFKSGVHLFKSDVNTHIKHVCTLTSLPVAPKCLCVYISLFGANKLWLHSLVRSLWNRFCYTRGRTINRNQTSALGR